MRRSPAACRAAATACWAPPDAASGSVCCLQSSSDSSTSDVERIVERACLLPGEDLTPGINASPWCQRWGATAAPAHRHCHCPRASQASPLPLRPQPPAGPASLVAAGRPGHAPRDRPPPASWRRWSPSSGSACCWRLRGTPAAAAQPAAHQLTRLLRGAQQMCPLGPRLRWCQVLLQRAPPPACRASRAGQRAEAAQQPVPSWTAHPGSPTARGHCRHHPSRC